MTRAEGPRPQTPPRPTNPPDGPAGDSFRDPLKLDRAARIALNSLARRGLTYADLRAPVEHVRAA
jgi:hypothetical protein